MPKNRQHVIVCDAADTPLGRRIEAHRDMLLEIAPGQIGHCRATFEPGDRRQRHRLFARLDAGFDERGPLAVVLRLGLTLWGCEQSMG